MVVLGTLLMGVVVGEGRWEGTRLSLGDGKDVRSGDEEGADVVSKW